MCMTPWTCWMSKWARSQIDKRVGHECMCEWLDTRAIHGEQTCVRSMRMTIDGHIVTCTTKTCSPSSILALRLQWLLPRLVVHPCSENNQGTRWTSPWRSCTQWREGYWLQITHENCNNKMNGLRWEQAKYTIRVFTYLANCCNRSRCRGPIVRSLRTVMKWFSKKVFSNADHASLLACACSSHPRTKGVMQIKTTHQVR